MAEPDLARILLTAAERDGQAFDRLATDPALHDSLAGFHAQQAVEKALKAVLADRGVVFRRTHDIAELLDLLQDSGLPGPPHADHLDELNPYAVEMRYGLVEPGPLERNRVAAWVHAVLSWAQTMTDHPYRLDIHSEDGQDALAEQVQAASADGRTLLICGGGSKVFYGNPVAADAALDCTAHTGVVAYEPTELAITVRGGTRLADIEALLAAQGQQLPFEPPHFAPSDDTSSATIGGTVAAGLSGPRRPYAASVRDALLGVRLLNGRGQVLDFGGRVMKNVAGYDVSRLMAGAMGVLGVLLEVSLKVIPRAPGSLTLVREEPLPRALELLRRWSRRALPITASAWVDGRLYLRIDGGEEALAETHRLVEGLPLTAADTFWRDLRDQRLGFFAGDAPLWRLSLPPATAADVTDVLGAGTPLIEWGGALRWLNGELPVAAVREIASAAGGHATLFRVGTGARPADGVLTPLAPVPLRLHRNLKDAFDPTGILNPGRLYPDL